MKRRTVGRLVAASTMVLGGVVASHVGFSRGPAGVYLVVLVVAAISVGLLLYEGDAGELGFVLLASYLMYVLGHPLNAVRWGSELSSYVAYLGVALVGLGGLATGYVMVSRVLRPRVRLPVLLSSDIRVGTWLTGLAAVGSLVTYFSAFGGISGFLQTGYGGEHWRVVSEGGIIGPGMQWLGLFSALSIIYGTRSQRALGACAGVLWMVLNLGAGGRGVVLNVGLVLAVLWYYSRSRAPRISMLALVAGATSIYLAAQYFAVVREHLSTGTLTALSTALARVRETPSILLPWAWGEFVAPGGALQELLLSSGQWDYQLGGTYVGALLYAIPGLNRLLDFTPLSMWRMEVFHPDLWGRFAGLGFFAAAEGYVNFGVVGVALHMGLLGAIAGLLHVMLRYNNGPSAVVLYAVSFPVLALAAMRIDVATWFWSYTHAYLAPWILMNVLAVLRQGLSRRWSSVAGDSKAPARQ